MWNYPNDINVEQHTYILSIFIPAIDELLLDVQFLVYC